MSFIGRNIKKIRSVKKLSQNSFAELFNLTRASVGAYEEERAEPKLEIIVSIAKYFNISIDHFITKELTINEIYHIDVFKDYVTSNTNSPQSQQLLKNSARLVTLDKIQEYINNIGNKQFLSSLDIVKLPYDSDSELLAFEHYGCEMHYYQSGIFQGDILYCKLIDSVLTTELKINALYVIVTNGRLIMRRLYQQGPYLTFKPDNSLNEIITLHFDEIIELWEVIGVFTKNIQMPSMIEERLYILENKVSKWLK